MLLSQIKGLRKLLGGFIKNLIPLTKDTQPFDPPVNELTTLELLAETVGTYLRQV